jgi:hypothetical protein
MLATGDEYIRLVASAPSSGLEFLFRFPKAVAGLKRSKKRLHTGVHGFLAFEEFAIELGWWKVSDRAAESYCFIRRNLNPDWADRGLQPNISRRQNLTLSRLEVHARPRKRCKGYHIVFRLNYKIIPKLLDVHAYAVPACFSNISSLAMRRSFKRM